MGKAGKQNAMYREGSRSSALMRSLLGNELLGLLLI